MHILDGMIDTKETEKKKETAILIGRHHQKLPLEKTQEYLDELEFLASTLGIETSCRFTQNLEKPDKKTFLGKGKIEEVEIYVKGFEIDTIIFDDDLSPSQVRNLENILQIKIYDRSLLILDIFLSRAQTSQAKTQVELARAQYLLPRLTNMWTHLERQRGGTATRGGSGEKEIETDKRDIRDKITKLKGRLAKIEKQGKTQRKNRKGVVRLALVGYTNAGKSTLMNQLTDSKVFAENKLFATVDATVKKINFNGIPGLLSDTVGFIRKLPTTLIESFKSTLAEAEESDLLLHVVDVSDKTFEDKITVVKEILTEIGAGSKRTIIIFNKVDLLNKEETDSKLPNEETVTGLISQYNDANTTCIATTATNKQDLAALRALLEKETKSIFLARYPNYINHGYYDYSEEEKQ